MEFRIQNEGSGDMNSDAHYRVYKGDSLVQGDTPFQLTASEFITVSFPGSGESYRLEADQVAGHPGSSNPSVWVQGCGGPPYDMYNINSYAHDDQDHNIDIQCQRFSASYDPNDKTVVPAGIGSENYIELSDTVLQYRIRFQNTGTDTAFNIIVVDTLDAEALDITSFNSGAASHPYWLDISGPGIVAWHFDDIQLPDSNVNEPLSHGYLNFRINRISELQLGTTIENDASIYFDYNAPILTNEAYVTLYNPDLLVPILEEFPFAGIEIYPNPSSGFVSLNLISADYPWVHILDIMGRIVASKAIYNGINELDLNHLESGVYALQLESQTGISRKAGKLIVNR